MSVDLLARARSGDGAAFEHLVEPYCRELQVHCYRMLGSVQDAEDAMQETLLAAWRGLPGFEERASLRTWLYRVATSRCLNLLRGHPARRKPAVLPSVEPPTPSGLGEVLWLEPYPDVLLAGVPDRAPGPEARYESREAISLAFVTAVQLLPPRQRAALLLRDVLGFRAAEVAQMLESTEESVTSALKRARAALQARLEQTGPQEPPPAAGSAAEEALVAALTRAFEAGDVPGIVALLSDDVRMSMPPLPLEYYGRGPVGAFFEAVAFRGQRTWRLVSTRANGQPAFATYVRDGQAALFRANGLLVLTLSGDRVAAITRFDPGTLPRLGLPRTLPDEEADAPAVPGAPS